MKKDDIERIKSLDPQSLNGTIQNILLSKDIEKLQFSETLFYLLTQTLSEKQQYADENRKLVNILKDHGLYTSELVFGGV